MQSAGRSSSASPSSSSSSHLGLDQIHQQQQQLTYRQLVQQQQQQQQQLRKGEGEDGLLPYQHEVDGGSNYSSSSCSIPMPQAGRKLSDLPHQHSEYQNKGQAMGQHMQNRMHQAYLQLAQHKSHENLLMHQHGMVGPSGRDRDMVVNNFKMQDSTSLQAAAQSQGPMFKKPAAGQNSNEERNERKPYQQGTRQLASVNMIQPVQLPQSQVNTQHAPNNHLGMAQWQAFQTWARDNNIDLSVPANMTLMNQLLPLWQSARMTALRKQNETPVASQSNLPSMKNQVLSSSYGNENSARGNSAGDVSGQAAPVKGRQVPSGSLMSVGVTMGMNSNLLQMRQQPTSSIREKQNEKAGKSQMVSGNGGLSIQLSQTSGSISESMVQSNAKNASSEPETLQTQQLRSLQQMAQPISQPGVPSSESAGFQIPLQGGSVRMTPSHLMFTKQQLHVLKAQILAFRRIKRGERSLPPEVLQAIVPPPLDLQFQQALVLSGMVNQETSAQNDVDEHAGYVRTSDMVTQLTPSRKGSNLPEEEPPSGEDKVAIVNHMQRATCSIKGTSSMLSVGDVEHDNSGPLEPEKEADTASQSISAKGNYDGDKGKSVSMNSTNVDSVQVKKDTPSSSTPPSKDLVTRKYHGPLFDSPSFMRKLDSGAATANYLRNMSLVYDARDLLAEGKDVVKRKRTENMKKISGVLNANLERKIIKPDLVLRLQIEEKKLRLLELQARLRDGVDHEQQEIMAMPDRPYRTFVRHCERQRIDLLRQVQQLQKVSREKQLKSIFQWRKKLLEAHWSIRDARTARNRGVAKYHERMLKEFSKRKDGDRNKRMEALKNNDVDRYRQILMEQQTGVPGDAAQRYSVLSSFLSQTEEYLHKLGGKITAAKTNQEVEEAANVAARGARSQGLSEEEVKAAAACAREEVMIRNRFSEMNAPKDSPSVNKYYNLAHAVNERVARQPSMLRTGTLRDYQLVGLQWMLSLYNNKLNGILADEMGLGKTVQVMALIAYLMEFKGNYGPHLIIVPNAVLVNWKSELLSWLPSITCIFYVGAKDQRSKLFSHEVVPVKFNVLVTTYEFVMYDRSKLSKINWKYIIIDEAQRMKDRESVLARDLDRYRCQRRLLLTGTPLQNDLKELWSLLNLLLPEVFDNRKAFHDWFAKPFQKDGPSRSPEEDDWLETEKKVIIIHRLHQILEPFMLRRRVEDVEGSLPRKVSIVLRCRMSAIQGAVYDWIKSTGTVRVDPEDEMRRVEKNPMYQVKTYKNLNNKCMELRKVCNHPLLNYPYFNDYSKDFIVRSCGKLCVLDRILIKLHRAGHRVLLFSTMTKLLDILEEYLQWKRLTYRRIDGTTSLEDRESAIVDFNRADSDCFIFLLSIRAAGRGLNLQTADTVVIYDPDPNPQNEEQAVARAHRIGQKREVKVIYMEAVVDKISSFQKEDEWRNGSTESEDDLVGKDRYIGSIESLIRTNIQQYKLDMADEVINAGRFDQRTTHEERRMTLETLLHDEERYQENVHDVPSLQEVNRMIARSDEEVELFDQMDEELDWTREMVKYNQVPKWLRAGSKEVNTVIASLSKKPSKNILTTNNIDSSDTLPGLSPSKTESKRGRPKRTTRKQSIYREYDEDEDNDGDHSDAISEEGKEYSQHEEGERREFEYEEVGAVTNKDKSQSDEEGMICEVAGYESSRIVEGNRSIHMFEEAGSTGFGSLAALDTEPGHVSKKMPDELEEGEIAVSGDSHMDLQQSGSWIHERDDGEEQVLQPQIKRKRSTRIRPRYTPEILEKASSERTISHYGSQLLSLGDRNYDVQLRTDKKALDAEIIPNKNDMNSTSLKQRHNFASRKVSPLVLQKSGSSNYQSESVVDITDYSNWTGKSSGEPCSLGSKMSDSTQRKCKNVISKFQRRIDRDGQQIIPLVYGFWKRNETPTFGSHIGTASSLPDLQRIEQRVDGSEYNGVMDFVADVQLMLKNVVRYNSYSNEIRNEAGKLQDLFYNIMKIAFPDTDFRESKNAVTFSGGGGPASTIQSPKQVTSIQGKRYAQTNNVETDFRPPKSVPRGPDDDEGRSRGYTSKPPKEPSFPTSRIGTHDCEQPILESTSTPAHPGDLVICKRKRKDRDKQKAGPTSPPSNPGHIEPLSPAIATAWIASGPGGSVGASSQKDARTIRPDLHPTTRTGGSSVADVQWAKPVKRLRTDKRRPSHS